jgi:hypothetical protein
LTPNLKPPRVPPTLADVTAAFTFSRLPREQRIAITLLAVMKNNGMTSESVENVTETMPLVAAELAKYSVKDFAVRYGHLEDGNAKA